MITYQVDGIRYYREFSSDTSKTMGDEVKAKNQNFHIENDTFVVLEEVGDKAARLCVGELDGDVREFIDELSRNRDSYIGFVRGMLLASSKFDEFMSKQPGKLN